LIEILESIFHKFSYNTLKEQAFNLFGTIISDDKLSVAYPGETASFIGYNLIGSRLVRPSLDWFKMAMCPEKSITDTDVSASRIAMLYNIGGCNDEAFSHFCLNYVRHIKR
jgi:hypothetical protein